MAKITIHRALAELKLIDSKISKRIGKINIVGLKTKNGKVNDQHEDGDFGKNVQSDYDSIIGLIKRKSQIKTAINKSNVKTLVIIGKVEMTVAEAIVMKSIVDIKRDLHSMCVSRKGAMMVKLERDNHAVDHRALELAKTALGKDNVKLSEDDVKNVTNPYMDANKLILVDPLGADEKMKTLESEVEEFEADVDATLSESNATTFIELED